MSQRSFICRPFSLTNVSFLHLFQAVPASQKLAKTWYSFQSCEQSPATPELKKPMAEVPQQTEERERSENVEYITCLRRTSGNS